MSTTIGELKESIRRMEETWGDVDDLPVVYGATTQDFFDNTLPYTAPEAIPLRIQFMHVELSSPSPGALLIVGISD